MSELRLVKFGAPWCAMCGVMDSLVAKLAEYHGLEVERVDVDEDPVEAERYGVRGLPTFVLLEDGEETGRTTGAKVFGALERELGLKALDRV